MTIQLNCPVCSSEDVYCQVNTLHCKRCGNIWKEEKKPGSILDERKCAIPVNDRILIKPTTDTTDARMEKKLEGYLKKFRGKFNLDTIPWTIGDIQMTMFRRYLKKCVKNKTLQERKDQYGIVWYSRPD